MGISYITREDVVSALGDISPAARGITGIDRAIDAGSRAVEALCHRRFWPQVGARVLDRDSNGEHLWFDADEMLSLTSLVVDGSTEPAANYRLSPASGPPYTSLKFAGPRSFSRDTLLTATGVFGSCDDQVAAGAAAEAMDATETDLDVTDGSAIGVGDLLKIDSERFLVTGRTWLTTAQTLQIPLTASAAGTAVGVTTGTAYRAGEVLMLDTEQMLVTDVVANTLVVRRAVNGTVLATHTGSTIYASRTLTVTRGAAGSTAATHLTAAPITKLQAPSLVRALALAEAVNTLQLAPGGYIPESGSGENARKPSGSGLERLRTQCYAAHGRKARIRALGGVR